MRLNEIFQLLHISCEDSRIIKGISDDSRCVSQDWLFVCRKGYRTHGSTFINEAVNKGAVVLCDMEMNQKDVYCCENIENIIQALIEMYYGDLCASMHVIAVTGTNGKTSVSGIITQLLRMQHAHVMRIGTHELSYPDHDEVTDITTPNCFALANCFRHARENGITHVVMEVSSHAIDQNRICFIQFDMIVYTNITQDHLDYHLTKTHYRYTKFKLRRYLKAQGAIIYNNDLAYMHELVNLAHHACISVGCKEAHFNIRDIQISDQGIRFTLNEYTYQCKLLGMVNVYNVAQALIVMRRLNYSYTSLQTMSAKLQTIEGRLEVLCETPFRIWIDYAHTPDALKTLLEFAVMVKRNRVIVVFGCGGNREKEKRVLMANIARRYADISIFTNDNPRFERTSDILKAMCKSKGNTFEVFENRYFALKHAVKIAQKDDIIIIAGKGNEQTLEIRGMHYPFSDRVCLLERLKEEETSWN